MIDGIYLVGEKWHVTGSDLSLGQSIGGRSQYAANIDPLWTAQFTYRIPKSKYLEWEAWRDMRGGQLRPHSVSPVAGRKHMADVGSLTFTGGVTFGSGVTFGGVDSFGGKAVTFRAAGNQFSRFVSLENADELGLGKFIWIGQHMHRVVGVSGSDVTIAPPLRENVSIGTLVFAQGTVSMVLAAQGEGVLERTPYNATDVSVSMIEAR